MITAKKCKVQTRDGASQEEHKEGLVAYKIVDLADILSKMDSSQTISLLPMSGGDVIVDVQVHVNVPLGEAGLLDIGADANIAAAADADGFLDGANCNVADSFYGSAESAIDATALTYSGALLDGGYHVCVADGFITAISSADNTDTSALTGSIIVKYLPG